MIKSFKSWFNEYDLLSIGFLSVSMTNILGFLQIIMACLGIVSLIIGIIKKWKE